jgi:hypothetical protein
MLIKTMFLLMKMIKLSASLTRLTVDGRLMFAS